MWNTILAHSNIISPQYPLAYFSEDIDGKKKRRNLVPDLAALRKLPESLL
jgi:hypothetical protein